MNKENKRKTKSSSGSKQTAAQETTNITLILKKDKDTVVTLYVCIQPLDGYAGVSPYAWFEDVHLKELVGVAHEMLLSTSAETLEGDGNPRCQLRRGENTRILFVFNEARPFPFHILVPSKSYSPAAEAPTVAFITEYGRRVFPFVEHSTKGGGFKLLCMHKNVVCAYVDCHEGDSPLGVSQIMKKFNVQTHSEAELKVSTDPGGKKAGAKRKKKGQQEGPAKKSRESDTEGQLAERTQFFRLQESRQKWEKQGPQKMNRRKKDQI